MAPKSRLRPAKRRFRRFRRLVWVLALFLSFSTTSAVPAINVGMIEVDRSPMALRNTLVSKTLRGPSRRITWIATSRRRARKLPVACCCCVHIAKACVTLVPEQHTSWAAATSHIRDIRGSLASSAMAIPAKATEKETCGKPPLGQRREEEKGGTGPFGLVGFVLHAATKASCPKQSTRLV